MGNRRAAALATMLALALAACSAEQLRNRRIERNWELFSSFSPDIQAKVRLGEIDIGYTRDMVRLAWGPPDRVYRRRTKEGATNLWYYARTETSTHRKPYRVLVPYRDEDGKKRMRYETMWIDYDRKLEYLTRRVEFAGEQVVSIEELSR